MDVCPILVGRDHELATLLAALESGGGVVLVAGEAGIGKSRLLREFAAKARERGRTVVWGRPEVVAAPGPYSVVIDVLENLAAGSFEARQDALTLANLLSGS